MSLSRDLGRVADLAKVVGSVGGARAVLHRLGVREERGFFSRRAFLDALAGREPPMRHLNGARKSDAIECVRTALSPLGVEVTRGTIGKSITVWLKAVDEPRTIRSDDFDFDPISLSDAPVAARVNIVRARRSGAPHFSASLAGAGDVAVYLFVLLSEKKVWLVRRDELEAIEDWLNKPKARPEGARDALAGAGFAAHGSRPRTLRLWMPLSTGTGLDLRWRIATPSGQLVGLTEGRS